MLGAFIAYSLVAASREARSDSGARVLLAAARSRLIGAAIEMLLLKRIYAAPELLQLAATFGIVLIIRDAALAHLGRRGSARTSRAGIERRVGDLRPRDSDLRPVPARRRAARAARAVGAARTNAVRHARRAATENRIARERAWRQRAARCSRWCSRSDPVLAGLAGALQLPREPANLGMDLAVIAEAFVVTVVGGLGSIPGAFVAALLIGLTKALCIALGTVDLGGIEIAFPKLTLVAEFVVMAIVLVVKPHGLMGAAPSMPPTTPLAEFRTLVVAARPPRRSSARSRSLALAAALCR